MTAVPLYIAPEHAAVRDACIERGQLRPQDRADIERIKAMPLEDVGAMMAESVLRGVALMNKLYLERMP